LSQKKIYKALIGRKLIETAIKTDAVLVEILKIEVKRLKKLAKSNNSLEEIQKINSLIMKAILAFTITDEKVKTGIELCMDDSDNQEL
jgi:hypothetical protein